MNIKLIASSLAACVLAACQSPDSMPGKGFDPSVMNDTRTGNYQTTPVNMPDEFYECKKGMGVKVKYLGNSRISIAMDTDSRATAVLSQTRAASGELYTNPQGLYGKRTEWHQKGGETVFEFSDPYGNLTETTCVKK